MTRRIVGCVAAIITLSATAKSAYADAYGYYPNSPLHLGGSFDPRKMSNIYLPCIAYDGVWQTDKLGAGSGAEPPSDPSKAVAVSTEFSAKQVKTRQELYDYLHVSASVSGHYSYFSGAAAVDYERENSFESDSFTWIVRGYSSYGSWALRNPRPNVEAEKLKKNVNALYQRCGTEWVGKESRAVMIAVVYSVKNLSQSAKEHLTASFKGGIEAGVWGADAAANYDKFKKEASSAANLNLNVYAMGGPGITVLKGLVSNANDIAIIKQTIEDYTGKLTADYAVPIDYLTGPMMSFMSGNGDFDLALYNKAIADLYLAKEDYIAKRNRLKSINDNADDYNLSEPQLQVIQQHYDGISKVIAAYDDVAESCRNAFLGARGDRVRDRRISSASCNINDPRLLYTKKIVWPAPQPFAVTWWTEDNQFAPKRWLYTLVKGPRLAEANILANDNTVLLALKVEDDASGGKKATGALEFSGVAAAKFPFTLSMKAESGQEYTKKLNLTPQSNVPLAVLENLSTLKLSVKPLSEVLKSQDVQTLRNNMQTIDKLNQIK